MKNIDSNTFATFLKEIKTKIYSAKSKAILSANRLMIELYFEIGKEIVIKQEVLGWGKSIVEKMSQDLKDEFGEKSGYSSSNLWRMRNFYLAYKDNSKLAQSVREISWGQNIIIFEKIKDDIEKEYYINNTIENGWNRNVLMHHIKTNLFERDKLENKSNSESVIKGCWVDNSEIKPYDEQFLWYQMLIVLYEMFMQYPVILLILMQVRICMLMGVII
jgi:predicted nuclease of restriction endonuclease-like (RecB) superfamily